MKPEAPVTMRRGSAINSAHCTQIRVRLRRRANRDVDGYTDPVHEMGIALEVYRTCRETVEANGGGRLDRVRLAVGELSAVEPDLLVYAWEAVVIDTPDHDASLEVEWCRANQYCSVCDGTKERSEGSWLRLCPDCGMPLQVEGGDELDVLDLSFETDEPSDGLEDRADSNRAVASEEKKIGTTPPRRDPE